MHGENEEEGKDVKTTTKVATRHPSQTGKRTKNER
jgi:hypothetical protein